MAKSLVGYRFCPTGEELINYYLKNKILGKTWLVEEAISEINICSKEPMLLPSLAKIQSDDPVWYFFSPKEYTSATKKVTKRTTGSGYWKVTGVDRKIRDKRGNGVEIGIKKTLVYYEGKVPTGVRTPWVMHEYHITSLPLNHKSTYVICQVMYNGEVGDISNGNQLSESSHSLVTAPKTFGGINTPSEVKQSSQEDGLYMKDYGNGLLGSNGGDFENMVSDQEFRMEENRNDHKPKKPLSGIIVYCSSDSDAESISAMSNQGTSSPVDSVGSTNNHFSSSSSTDSCKDLQTSADSSISRKKKKSKLTRSVQSKQEVREGRFKAVAASMVKKRTEKKGLIITEDVMENMNSPFLCLINIAIGLILLLGLSLAISNRVY